MEARRVLRGERVLLRPLASSDLRRCVKWFSDPQIIRFLGRDAPVTLAEEERWFRDYERRTDEQIFAIEVEGQHVGNLGLHKIDRVHRKAEVGIVIGEPSFWSQGYGTEAMRVVLQYGFDGLGSTRSRSTSSSTTPGPSGPTSGSDSSARACTARTSTRTGAS